jgi:hypothetical protein
VVDVGCLRREGGGANRQSFSSPATFAIRLPLIFFPPAIFPSSLSASLSYPNSPPPFPFLKLRIRSSAPEIFDMVAYGHTQVLAHFVELKVILLQLF